MRQMRVRERIEQEECARLSPLAQKAALSRGRPRPEPPDAVRTAFQRDRDRIIHCKAFRRLKHKTQVFIAPAGDHYRTRLTHTLEVAQIGRTIARALRLNEDLVEAISLAHDLGHAPVLDAGTSLPSLDPSKRINTLFLDLTAENSPVAEPPEPTLCPYAFELTLSPPIEAAADTLRSYLYNHVYTFSAAKAENG